MRIAIASSGLGHVARGIETWAMDSAVALSGFRVQGSGFGGEGTGEVTLFAGAAIPPSTLNPQPFPLNPQPSTINPSPTTINPSPSTIPHKPLAVAVLPCWRRAGRLAQALARWSPGFTWRWGLKNPYGWEQLSFWLKLWPRLVRGRFDILHVQDPMLADWCRRCRRLGLVRTKEILAHGTEEPPEFLERFEYVQHLAPWHLSQTEDRRQETEDRRLGAQGNSVARTAAEFGIGGLGAPRTGRLGRHRIATADRRAERTGHLTGARRLETEDRRLGTGDRGPKTEVARINGRRLWVAMPNFVDCSAYRPASTADERLAARRKLGVPEDAFVVGCVAAVKKDHKRIDYLIREVAGFRVQGSGGAEGSAGRGCMKPTPHGVTPSVFLLVAGARTDGTPELQGMAETMIPGRHRFLLDCPRDQMPDLYRAMDVFVLPSLFEMMPIALLEAMAAGLPCLVNQHPVLEWMIGAGGWETADRRLQTEDHQAVTVHGSPSTMHSLLAGRSLEMSREGALAVALGALTPEWIAARGEAARQRAVSVFATEAVIGQYVAYYREVMGRS